MRSPSPRRVAERLLTSRELQPGLRQVRNGTFWWSTDRPVEIGFRVPLARPRRADVEGVFEEVRKELAPAAPSRLHCVFVCPLPGRGFCSPRHPYVYKVRVSGTVFTTDGGFFTEAIFARPDPEVIRGWAESYWAPRGSLLINHAEETLVDGSVVVVGPA